MKKLLIVTLAGLSVAWFVGGSNGAKGKFHPKQNTAMTILDTVPDSPKKIQLVSYLMDSVPDSPKKKQLVSYIMDSVPDSPKKIQLVAYMMDTVPDSPKKVNLIAMR